MDSAFNSGHFSQGTSFLLLGFSPLIVRIYDFTKTDVFIAVSCL